MTTLKQLAANHPYYCEESNYHSAEAFSSFETMTDFLDEMEDADVDMNLCFRWDVELNIDAHGEQDPKLGYMAKVFIMHQRKGQYWPNYIKSIHEGEVPRFQKYLEKHYETLQKLWEPIS